MACSANGLQVPKVNPSFESTPSSISSVIFMGITGVLQRVSGGPNAYEIARRLYPDVVNDKFTDMQLDTAATHLYNESALQNLQVCLQSAKKVGIVMNTSIGNNRSVAQVKKILEKHPFSAYIIGLSSDNNDRGLSEFEMQNAGKFKDAELPIAYWLENHPQIKDFVIFEKHTSHEETYPHFLKNVVKIDTHRLLTAENCAQARDILGIKV